jgi:hypothetical protein
MDESTILHNAGLSLFQEIDNEFVVEKEGPTSLVVIDNTLEAHEVVFCSEYTTTPGKHCQRGVLFYTDTKC